MKMSASNKMIVAMLVFAALAVAFWLLLLSPKREEASELAAKADQLGASLAESRRQVVEAGAAKRAFPGDYRRLVVLGQAAPDNEETASLLVELHRIARHAKVRFDSIELESGEGAAEPPAEATPTTPPPAATGVPTAAVPATEAAASLLPLGATIGPAGLGVMPYKLSFSGDFFRIADFLDGIDSLVHDSDENVDVDGRLLTIDGFALKEHQDLGFPYLEASFSVTTYLTPPGQSASTESLPAETTIPTTTPTSTEAPETAEAETESSPTVANAN